MDQTINSRSAVQCLDKANAQGEVHGLITLALCLVHIFHYNFHTRANANWEIHWLTLEIQHTLQSFIL